MQNTSNPVPKSGTQQTHKCCSGIGLFELPCPAHALSANSSHLTARCSTLLHATGYCHRPTIPTMPTTRPGRAPSQVSPGLRWKSNVWRVRRPSRACSQSSRIAPRINQAVHCLRNNKTTYARPKLAQQGLCAGILDRCPSKWCRWHMHQAYEKGPNARILTGGGSLQTALQAYV